VVDPPDGRGLVDTSVVIGHEQVDPGRLPLEISISTLTLAELTSGPLATSDDLERARRQERLQRFEAGVESLDFTPSCARAYGYVYAAAAASIAKLAAARMLGETQVRAFAEAKQFAEMACALSTMTRVSLKTIETT